MKCFQPRWTCRSRSFFRKNSIVKNNAEEGETFHYPSVAKLLLSSLLSNSSPYDLATNFSILFFSSSSLFYFSFLLLYLCARVSGPRYTSLLSPRSRNGASLLAVILKHIRNGISAGKNRIFSWRGGK